MTGPRARVEAWLDRLLARPLVARLDPYLGIGDLRRFNPLVALIPITLMALLGVRTSQFGHIDTVGGIFPIISLVSALSPFVGLLSGLAFGAADLAQKFMIDDVFYEGTKTTVDYWGARSATCCPTPRSSCSGQPGSRTTTRRRPCPLTDSGCFIAPILPSPRKERGSWRRSLDR